GRDRTFLSWQPTGAWTPHRPEKFGTLRLVGGGPDDDSTGGSVSVTFLTYTNNPYHWSHQRTCLFVITNQFNYAINYQAGRYAAQLKSNGVWYALPEINDAVTYGSEWGSEWGLLEPGAWRNVVVAVPYEATVWRATVRTLRVPYWRIAPP